MIRENELRIGNYILQKVQTRVVMARCSYAHFELLAKGEEKDLFPVVLKAEILEKCGFIENKEYPLLPSAREFKLVLPVIGSGQNEILAYIKNNQECFGRASVGTIPASNNFHYLHQLQNLYFALTGDELAVKL